MFSLVVLAVFVCGALAQSTCYGVTTTCVITNACNTCFPNPAGCTASYDPVTDITTLTTTSFQDYTIGGAVTGTFSYPAGVVLVFRNDVRFGTSTVSFCVPSLRSYLPAGTALMTMPINTRVVMEGAVTLRTGSVVPSSVALLNGAGVATGNFIGVFSSIQAIGVPITCFTTLASAQYTANSISVTLTQTNTGVGTCVPSEGLSGGAIAGIVIGVLVGVALLVVLAIFLLKKLDFDSKRQLFSRTKIHAAESSVPM